MSSRRRSRSRDRDRDRHRHNDVTDTQPHSQSDRTAHEPRPSGRDDDTYKHSDRHKSDSYHSSSSLSRVPRSKRHRDSTFVSHWDELPDPNHPPIDPLSYLQSHPNAPKSKTIGNAPRTSTDGMQFTAEYNIYFVCTNMY